MEEQSKGAQLDMAALAMERQNLVESDADPMLQSAAAAANDPVANGRGALKRQAMLKRPATAQAKYRWTISSAVLRCDKLTQVPQTTYIQLG